MNFRNVEWRATMLAQSTSQLTNEQLGHKLDEVIAFADERSRAETLAALAPYLTGALLRRGFDSAMALIDTGLRAHALAAFLPHTPDQAAQLKAIRQAIADHLLALKQRRRQEVLESCAVKELFTPPIFSQAALSALAAHIVEICQEWRWL